METHKKTGVLESSDPSSAAQQAAASFLCAVSSPQVLSPQQLGTGLYCSLSEGRGTESERAADLRWDGTGFKSLSTMENEISL